MERRSRKKKSGLFTGSVFLQLVSQHCCIASWNPLLRVLPRLRPTCFAAKYSVASLQKFRRIIGQSCVIFRDSEVLSVWSLVSFQIARRKVVFLWQFLKPFWLFAAACFERTRCSWTIMHRALSYFLPLLYIVQNKRVFTFLATMIAVAQPYNKKYDSFNRLDPLIILSLVFWLAFYTCIHLAAGDHQRYQYIALPMCFVSLSLPIVFMVAYWLIKITKKWCRSCKYRTHTDDDHWHQRPSSPYTPQHSLYGAVDIVCSMILLSVVVGYAITNRIF